jgi:nucleotide-binding universal stress UspA family protein
MKDNYLIIVGVDGSEGGRRALDWAATEAVTRGGAVQALVAWRWDGIDIDPGTATNKDEQRRHAQAILDREMAGLAARHGSSHPVAGEVVEGRAADALTGAARSADLLVLGSHGHGRLHHTVLGSVSEECIRKAPCPVLVVPVPVPAPSVSAEAAVPA